MRRMVEEIRERMAQFVLQRKDLILIVGCADADTAMVSSIATSLDESSTSELYWLVLDEFQDAPSYVEACVRSFAVKHDAAQLLLDRSGQPRLPELPAAIAAGQLPPVERLRELIIFSRSLLPTLEGCGVVWGFLPLKVLNPVAYAAFLKEFW